LFDLLFDPEDGSDTVLSKIGFCLNHVALQPRRLYVLFIVTSVRTSNPAFQTDFVESTG
jgi:hypothetical protein